MNAIEIRDLSKSYKDFNLEHLNLTLPGGCIMGLVGENGAGKSTTIKLILNMRHRNTNAGIVVFWVKLRSRGYTRSISGLYRFLRKRNSMAVKLPNPKKCTPKPYEQMSYPGQRVQTDNASEYQLVGTKNPKPTLFEKTLEQLNIRHKLIKPYTPRHNGKVERSHRKDNEEFYATHRFFSFVDFKL